MHVYRDGIRVEAGRYFAEIESDSVELGINPRWFLGFSKTPFEDSTLIASAAIRNVVFGGP
jgi:hypothetical protein